MTSVTRTRLVAVAFMLVALLAANALGDALRLAGTGDLRSVALTLFFVALLAAAYGFASARVRGVAPGRSAAIAALSASLAAFLLVRVPSPWIDLGPFGAGPLTAMALVLFPLAELAAVLAVARWTDR